MITLPWSQEQVIASLTALGPSSKIARKFLEEGHFGKRFNAGSCPVHHWLQEHFPPPEGTFWTVSPGLITLCKNPGIAGDRILYLSPPHNVRWFIIHFDQGSYPELILA